MENRETYNFEYGRINVTPASWYLFILHSYIEFSGPKVDDSIDSILPILNLTNPKTHRMSYLSCCSNGLEATSLPVHLLVVLQEQDFPSPGWPYLRHHVVLQVPKHTPFCRCGATVKSTLVQFIEYLQDILDIQLQLDSVVDE